VVGLLAPGEAALAAAEIALAAEFGPVSARSATIPFDFSDYYAAEMGPALLRRWVAHGPVERGRLAALKLAAGRIEAGLAESGRRSVNLDPGLLSPHSLVLASTKDFAHRIYLADGIFAEVTLVYRSGRFEPLDWTYPDYRTEPCHAFLCACRRLLFDAGMAPGVTLTRPRPAG
jgi:hypothetical protein